MNIWSRGSYRHDDDVRRYNIAEEGVARGDGEEIGAVEEELIEEMEGFVPLQFLHLPPSSPLGVERRTVLN